MVTTDDVIERLKQLGFDPEDGLTELDRKAIEFELRKTYNYIMNYCNIPTIDEIPEILNPRIIDKTCGEFLFYKKNSGSLPGFNYDPVIKSIREGDTTLTYAVGQGEDTPENRFDAFVKSLERGFDKWITPHRRLRW